MFLPGGGAAWWDSVPEYLTPTVVSPLPGSGTDDMVVTVKWHGEFTRSETTYLVPLWVPRRR